MGSVSDVLLLKRRTQPLPNLLGDIQTVHGRLGERVAVPAIGAPLFVTIDIHRSVIGSASNFIFRAPLLQLRAYYADGASEDFRLIPAIARGGAILVPTIAKSQEFAQIAAGDVSPAGSRRPVAFEVHSGRFGSLAYDSEVDFGFRPIDSATLKAAAADNPFLQNLEAGYSSDLPIAKNVSSSP